MGNGSTPVPRGVNNASLRTALAVLAVLAAMLLLGSGCGKGAEKPEAVAGRFLSSWAAREYESMYTLLDAPSRETYDREYFVNRYTNITDGIGLRSVETALGKKLESSENRTAFSVSVHLATDTVGSIPVDNTITLTRADRQSPWLVEWHPGLIFPELIGNRRVDLTRLIPKRGSIYDRNRRLLAGYRTLNEVGAVPGVYTDQDDFSRSVAALLGVSPQVIAGKLNQPWVKEGLYVPLAVLLPEQDALVDQLLQIKGVKIKRVDRRYYPAGALLAHVTGYTGEITAEELAQKRENGYYSGDMVGKMGLEAVLEDVLGGAFGFVLRILEEDGSEAAVIATRELRQGEDIVLTLDLDLQRAAVEALGNKVGAVVALDPATGKVLALASSPGFDPNLFVSGLSPEAWRALQDDPAQPFLNRALWGLYPPGSVFKPFTAAAAIEEKKLDPAERVRIEGDSWQPSPSWGGYMIKRINTAQTSLDLDAAMKYSDNIYFARAGLSLGAALFNSYGDLFGFGDTVPFVLPAAVSRLSRDGIKTEIQLADSSFGQGEVLSTPLHMALIYCPFAGNGGIPVPRLWLSGEPDQITWKEAAISPATAAIVHRALVASIHGANAPAAAGAVEGFTAAGKTGTAEVDTLEGNICWYVTYAPAGDPGVVVAAVVEGGGWAGEDALPVGRAVLEFFLGMGTKD